MPGLKSLKSFMEESFSRGLAPVHGASLPENNESEGQSLYPSDVETEETVSTQVMIKVKRQVCTALSDTSIECDSLFGVYGSYGIGKTTWLEYLATIVSKDLRTTPSANPTSVTGPPVRFAILGRRRTVSFERNDLPVSDYSSTLWGDLAYQLARDLGYQLFWREDGSTKPPSYDAISLLLKGGPTLILIDGLDEQLDDCDSSTRKYLEEFVLTLFEAVVQTPLVSLVFSASSESLDFDHRRLVKFQFDPSLTFVPNATHRKVIYQIASDRNLRNPKEATEWIFEQGINRVLNRADE
jgi:hypothetical protein